MEKPRAPGQPAAAPRSRVRGAAAEGGSRRPEPATARLEGGGGVQVLGAAPRTGSTRRAGQQGGTVEYHASYWAPTSKKMEVAEIFLVSVW